MAKKTKIKIDGLSPDDIKKIRNAIRQVWHRSHVRKLCVNRCTQADGFTFCEQCKTVTPKLKIDHKINVGAVDGGFISRMFVESSGLQGLCKKCHDEKTKQERKRAKLKKNDDDFY